MIHIDSNHKEGKQTDRWDYIDLLEFIGMLFVIIYHCTIYSYSVIENNSVIICFRYFLRTILSTCVPLFLFANGYLLFNKKFDLKKHIIKMIGLTFLTVIWGIINILFLMPINHEFLSIKEIIQYLWTWHQGWINHFWYMGTLICLYIFFPILKKVYDTNRNVFIYFISICAVLTFGNRMFGICGTIVASTLLGHQIDILNSNFFNMFNPFQGIYWYSFVYFCAGGLAHQFKGKIEQYTIKSRNIVSAGTIFISCLGLYATGIFLSKITGEMWDVVFHGYDTIFTFVNVLAIFVLSLSYSSSKNSFFNKYIVNISVNTLGIYFIHKILIQLSRPIVEGWKIAQNFVGCVLYSIIVMSVCLLVICNLKKIPLVNYLVDIKKLTIKMKS